MFKKIRHWICDHKLAVESIEYNTEEITCTATDQQIVCRNCGKVFIEAYYFKDLKELMGKI